LLLTGPRGFGKTVPLAEIASRAATAHGWPHLLVEVTPSAPFTAQLVAGAREIAQLFKDARPGERLHATEAGSAGAGGRDRRRSAVRAVLRAVDAALRSSRMH